MGVRLRGEGCEGGFLCRWVRGVDVGGEAGVFEEGFCVGGGGRAVYVEHCGDCCAGARVGVGVGLLCASLICWRVATEKRVRSF